MPFVDLKSTDPVPFATWARSQVDQEDKTAIYHFFDSPGLPQITGIEKELDYKIELTTYVVLSYTDPVNPLYNTTYPLAKLSWDATIYGKDFAAIQPPGSGFTVDNTKSSVNIGPSSIVHQYEAKYKLTPAIANDALPFKVP